jgi:2-polyprenyl-6-methoxyphenol hydroxylase-like FAD-dependent oxidoreductase
MTTYDAIVVGARCGGAPTAMLLARNGYRVLLLDRATFPSDTPTAHFVMPPGVAKLARWGLLDRVRETNCPHIPTWHLDLGPFTLVGSPPPIDGVQGAYGPRRFMLDKILVDAAVDAGVELRENFSVQELTTDGERITGIRGRPATGATVSESGRVVIGADGMRSLVAREVQASSYATKPPIACAYYGYFSDVPVDGVELYAGPQRAAIAFGTNDQLTCIFAEWPVAMFSEVRADVDGQFMALLDACSPGLAERVRGGRHVERFNGTADIPNFFRKPYGPGWALVGDAGYHKDPYLAQGISDAFRDAELLADALDAGFSGQQQLDDALAGYEAQRNSSAMPLYELNYQLASLEPPSPEQQQLFGALHGNQADTDRFFGTLCGTVPVQEFFAPDNLGRIIAGATAPVTIRA